MKKKLATLVIFLILITMILVVGWLFYKHRTDSAYQQNLLKQVKSLGVQEIVSVEILPGSVKRQDISKKMLTADEIQLVQSFLKNADIGPVGGHNYRIYECILTFEVAGNVTISFWGIVYGMYNWNKDDVFLLGYQSSGDLDSFWSQSRLVRVKNLGRWLIVNGPQKPQTTR